MMAITHVLDAVPHQAIEMSQNASQNVTVKCSDYLRANTAANMHAAITHQ